MKAVLNKKIIAIAGIIVCLIGGWYFYRQYISANTGILTLYGNIENRQVNLSFMVDGKIAKMLKEEGNSVEAGDLVAVLDKQDYVANYQLAVANVKQTKAVMQDCLLKFDRSKALIKNKAIPQQTFDSSQYAYETAKANYDVALSQETVAKNKLDYTELYAPEEGIISVRVVEPGTTVAAGQSVYTLSKLNSLWVRAFVSEKDLGNIKYGMPATVLTDTVNPNTGDNRAYKGHIGFISSVAEFTPKTVQSEELRTALVYRVHIIVDDNDGFLRLGMPVTAKIDFRGGK